MLIAFLPLIALFLTGIIEYVYNWIKLVKRYR